MTEFKTPAIHAAMIQVMDLVAPISKARKNQTQGYSFRGIDDFYEALQAILVKAGVYTTSKILADRSEDRQTAKGGTLIYRVLTIEYTFWCAFDGSFVTTTVIGEGMDSGDKASNKAMSVAHKYALMQAFAIPTSEPKDPEIDSHEIVSKASITPIKLVQADKPLITTDKHGEHVIKFGALTGRKVSELSDDEASTYCTKFRIAMTKGPIPKDAMDDFTAVKQYFGYDI